MVRSKLDQLRQLHTTNQERNVIAYAGIKCDNFIWFTLEWACDSSKVKANMFYSTNCFISKNPLLIRLNMKYWCQNWRSAFDSVLSLLDSIQKQGKHLYVWRNVGSYSFLQVNTSMTIVEMRSDLSCHSTVRETTDSMLGLRNIIYY